jgi:predicted alpha/beta hydrolase family esterase
LCSTLDHLDEGEAASMRQVLFVQGGGEGVHDRWDNRLVDSLRDELGPLYEIRYPVMPDEANPQYSVWKLALQRELASLEDGAIVVGHSVGGTILINALAEWTPHCQLGAICLIAAPFVGPGGWPSDDIEPRADLADRLPGGVPIFFYHGRDDAVVPLSHVDLYARAVPHATVRRLAGRDHQLDNRLSDVAADIHRLDRRSNADAAHDAADSKSPARSHGRNA